MSSVFRCDRCGEIFDNAALDCEPIVLYPATTNILGVSQGDESRETVDLCGTCTAQLEMWLANRPFETEPKEKENVPASEFSEVPHFFSGAD